MNDIPHIIEAALLLLVAFLLGCIIGWILRAKIFKKRKKPTPSNAVESVIKSETQILETVSNADANPVQVASKAAPEAKDASPSEATTPKLNVVSSKPRKASIANIETVKTSSPKSAVAKPASGADSSLIDSAKENTGKPDTGALDSGEPETGKPEALKAARAGGKDDLKKIKGVGPKLEGILNGLGIFHFDQIAKWKRAEIDWVDDYLSFKGRIDRDDWINQAKKFSS